MKILVGLHRNTNALDSQTAKISSDHGLTFRQFMVMEALYSKGEMTVGQVRDKILSSVGTISVIIDNLVKLNYVERLSDENDRRVSILRLTGDGKQVIEKVIPKNNESIVNYMEVLDVEDKETLLNLLKKLGGRLDE